MEVESIAIDSPQTMINDFFKLSGMAMPSESSGKTEQQVLERSARMIE